MFEHLTNRQMFIKRNKVKRILNKLFLKNRGKNKNKTNKTNQTNDTRLGLRNKIKALLKEY